MNHFDIAKVEQMLGNVFGYKINIVHHHHCSPVIVAENMALRASNTTLLAVDQASVPPAGNRVNLGKAKS